MFGGDMYYAHFRDAGGANFAVIGMCVGAKTGLRSIKIARKGKPDLWAYAGSAEAAKRHVERWVRSHWRAMERRSLPDCE